MIKQSDILNFISCSCHYHDVIMLGYCHKGKKDWSPLHSTSPFLEDFVIPTLRVICPLALGIYEIGLYMSVTHLSLH